MSDYTAMRRWSDWWEAHSRLRWTVGFVFIVTVGAVAMHYALR